jgi:hypothetical protein
MDRSPSDTHRRLRISVGSGIAVLALILLASFAIPVQVVQQAGAGTSPGAGAPGAGNLPEYAIYTPVFTDPAAKIKEISSQDFTAQLYREAIAFEPLLGTPGTQVHMGYWSGKGNHGSLIRLIDAINEMTPSPGEAPPKAIYDEGVNSYYQYPSYNRILEEHWYERATAINGSVTIFGNRYTDPYPVTSAQADDIWGQYSQRYADLAEPIRQATGKPVKVWCYVQGAKANRVFYKYELPELRSLEQKGAVQVYFAKTQDADWTNPRDWTPGTANAPSPVPVT